MSKYHISPQDNIARVCSAEKRGCDYGVSEDDHLTYHEAAEHNTKTIMGENPIVKSIQKDKDLPS